MISLFLIFFEVTYSKQICLFDFIKGIIDIFDSFCFLLYNKIGNISFIRNKNYF